MMDDFENINRADYREISTDDGLAEYAEMIEKQNTKYETDLAEFNKKRSHYTDELLEFEKEKKAFYEKVDKDHETTMIELLGQSNELDDKIARLNVDSDNKKLHAELIRGKKELIDHYKKQIYYNDRNKLNDMSDSTAKWAKAYAELEHVVNETAIFEKSRNEIMTEIEEKKKILDDLKK